ncbi:somatomedin-B and thrombospondin type-1 domain-containing protein isoform X3 [Chelonia mydas]|uniref:somatomedin-B and thrombospondin type-1 domain-containing protein isoform X3 n=1 Tax=Chelonia mydas TaxID=8469 RepID=UPI001CA98379|nr:somatomedin-B and thrombospondin type-1 domain-containing protein isoform X3 [Chelonia mydas]
MARGPGWLAAAAAAALLLLLLAPSSEAGCAELGRCCRGRDLACVSSGWRPDRSHGACYCDQACPRTMDCCHDYPQACPEVSCAVSEWSDWSGCAEPCQATYRVRRRHVVQEPRNGVPALITTGGYGRARKKRAASSDNEGAGYCVEFQITAIMEGCLQGNSSYTQWMRYLSEGHTVCVECQHPALDSRNLHCYGDGSGSKKNQLLHWQAMGNPQCRGTWRRVRQLDTCSCPSVHSFLFI